MRLFGVSNVLYVSNVVAVMHAYRILVIVVGTILNIKAGFIARPLTN
jgi:hypothetical protein